MLSARDAAGEESASRAAAERWASTWYGDFVHEEAALPINEKIVLRRAALSTSPAGAVAATVLALYGPNECREQARSVVDQLAARGVEMPAWLGVLGTASPVRAAVAPGLAAAADSDVIAVVDFAYPDGEVFGVGVAVNEVPAGAARAFTCGPTVEDLVASFPEADLISLARAGALLVPAVANRVHIDAHCLPGDGDLDTFWDVYFNPDRRLEALVRRSVALLPGPPSTPGTSSPLAAAPPLAADLLDVFAEVPDGDRPGRRRLAARVARFGEEWATSSPPRWGQRRVGEFGDWLWRDTCCPDAVDDGPPAPADPAAALAALAPLVGKHLSSWVSFAHGAAHGDDPCCGDIGGAVAALARWLDEAAHTGGDLPPPAGRTISPGTAAASPMSDDRYRGYALG